MSQVPEGRISHNNCSSGQQRVLGLYFRAFRDKAVLASIIRILVLLIIYIIFTEIGENLQVRSINSSLQIHTTERYFKTFSLLVYLENYQLILRGISSNLHRMAMKSAICKIVHDGY